MADQQVAEVLGRVFGSLGFSSVKPEQLQVVAGILKQGPLQARSHTWRTGHRVKVFDRKLYSII